MANDVGLCFKKNSLKMSTVYLSKSCNDQMLHFELYIYPQVSWTATLDELAEMIGVKPSPWQFFFTDPGLAWFLLLGPNHPARYRLQGPGAWPGARDLIHNSMSYTMSAVSPPGSYSNARGFLHTCYFLIGGVCFLIVVVVTLFLFWWFS